MIISDKMQLVNHLVKDSLPNYLSSLPIPDTILGWFSLGVGDWMKLIPFGVAVGGLSYLSLQGLANTPVVGPHIKEKLNCILGQAPARVNSCIQMDCPKVVDTIDIEDISEKAVLCRCWKSKKFPYCDGTHAKHNKETGDNVGPIIVKKSA
ncbi:CDGSH iron-sulfur domain-containing protein 2 homolog [Eurytemora carolleeae]|uniref:CDGSH iron-sulfur domain-containing protein 2 homolog n=1 Tax=Eurytemora carolleeae TaxID=1294199 RepID=UPI000C76A43D|nr:CDGSH iron-sulfur domain-containing protein 2 homolog [Eurytemora carolleeae]XP_023339438.1 CDGSH iron-sulfur domain-containing protein 2 homolog [Eurytemora carolleeae]|eukprot:XP_023339436.1 CDGSH iron-sulfur domain-containing protein 2 homolog [Eurytemora affinis]